ncbi:MAG: ASKHA domain-containing protein [Lachnospiraceae bacterium]|jgi:uncharacterized 2Fe-2S/4Fe-4S cluster protein (DUF4445 family)|nr:ASKHA domain-containing protein [Lachnospiraceae bacterium]
MTHTITIAGQKRRLTAPPGALLSELLLSAGLPLETPCGGKGVCKKCLVKVNGVPALSCQTRIHGDITVSLGPGSAYLPRLVPPPHIAPAEAPLYSKWGLSVDIGTTTINMTLIGAERNVSAVRKNPQVSMGADVLSRIEKALAGQLNILTNSLRTTLREMIADLTGKMKISGNDIDGMVITGNTTMLYLLAGLNPEALARAPFAADHLFGEMAAPEALELYLSPSARIYLPKCISAFVGADVVTAILASGMNNPKKTSLLIDFGTNGEVALMHEGTFYCASTAAGPAFEGYSLSGGSYAGSGAIDRVRVEKSGRLRIATIDNAPANGICGSGIIEALSVMLKQGIIDENGYLEEDFELANGIKITKKDIHKVQLAKGAIRAGLETLLAEAGLEKSQIDAFFISGDFGAKINMEHAAGIGLVPRELLPVVYNIGNAAHMGATMLLQNQAHIAAVEDIAAKARVIPLSTNPLFAEKFAEYMLF